MPLQFWNSAIGNRAFPACSVAITLGGELIAQKALGHFTYEISSPEVSNGTIFDLASLTKVVATTSMAMILYERGVLDLEAPVVAIIPEFVLLSALSTRSGHPSHVACAQFRPACL